jgi:hypothetical protein
VPIINRNSELARPYLVGAAVSTTAQALESQWILVRTQHQWQWQQEIPTPALSWTMDLYTAGVVTRLVNWGLVALVGDAMAKSLPNGSTSALEGQLWPWLRDIPTPALSLIMDHSNAGVSISIAN